MREPLKAFGPIFLFMLIPIWIPLFTVLLGALGDRLTSRPRRRTVAQRRRRAEPHTQPVTEAG